MQDPFGNRFRPIGWKAILSDPPVLTADIGFEQIGFEQTGFFKKGSVQDPCGSPFCSIGWQAIFSDPLP